YWVSEPNDGPLTDAGWLELLAREEGPQGSPVGRRRGCPRVHRDASSVRGVSRCDGVRTTLAPRGDQSLDRAFGARDRLDGHVDRAPRREAPQAVFADRRSP